MHIELTWLRRSGREGSDHPSTLVKTDLHLTVLQIRTWRSMIEEICETQVEGDLVVEDKEGKELEEGAEATAERAV